MRGFKDIASVLKQSRIDPVGHGQVPPAKGRVGVEFDMAANHQRSGRHHREAPVVEQTSRHLTKGAFTRFQAAADVPPLEGDWSGTTTTTRAGHALFGRTFRPRSLGLAVAAAAARRTRSGAECGCIGCGSDVGG